MPTMNAKGARLAAHDATPADAAPALPNFGYALADTQGAIAVALGAATTGLRLFGAGNTVLAGDGNVTLRGGLGLTTARLGNGNDMLRLGGALNTVVLGNGNDTVDLGHALASVHIGASGLLLRYGPILTATLGLPPGPLTNAAGGIGWFNGGQGDIGVFNGWGNASASDGNRNIGAFNGNLNEGVNNGNDNIGAFNGNLDGIGGHGAYQGAGNGNGNVGVLNGNVDGDLPSGLSSGNGNGDGNFGVGNGNVNGNGTTAMQPAPSWPWSGSVIGGFDTLVAGNGNNTVTALAGVSTIVLGNGNNQVMLGGALDTVVAGNGNNTVAGAADHARVALGNGANTMTLTGAGWCDITTGGGNDVIALSGHGNVVDAGLAPAFNTLICGAGGDTFVLHQAGGLDRIFGFALDRGDALDLRAALAGTTWTGDVTRLGAFLGAGAGGGGTVLTLSSTAGGPASAIADLVGVHATLAALLPHCLIA